MPLFLVGIITGCKKDSTTNTSGVPNVSVVGIGGSIYDAGYTNLQIIGSGWVYVGGGYDGIILFRNSPTTILAFDRGCPYDCETNAKAFVNIQTGNITAICPVCGTQYSLFSGTISNKGPGTIALKQYTVNFDETSGSYSLSN